MLRQGYPISNYILRSGHAVVDYVLRSGLYVDTYVLRSEIFSLCNLAKLRNYVLRSRKLHVTTALPMLIVIGVGKWFI